MNTNITRTPVNALDVANCLIEIANQVDENDLTNLKLQKILFFLQAEHLKAKQSPLFNEEIQAWKWGPVVPIVYHTFKTSGNFPITPVEITDLEYKKNLDEEMMSFIEKIWQKYGIFSAHKLVEMTHDPKSAWSKTYREDMNAVISLDDIVASI